jgi:hypothetical protein
MTTIDITTRMLRRFNLIKYMVIPAVLFSIYLSHSTYAALLAVNIPAFQIMNELSGIKGILSQIGPILSAMLFVLAGIFYALGQMLPPDRRANFHTTATNMVIGGVVVGVLSVSATSLALAATHLFSNSLINSTS